MIHLNKQKSKVILKKENIYSSNRFANRLKRKALASKEILWKNFGKVLILINNILEVLGLGYVL